jgi:hypothetical protein
MFARLTQRLASRSNRTSTPAPARRAMLETLEGRQLYSVSPMGQLPAVQQPTAVERPASIQLPAVQHTGGVNIIGILIGL